MNTEKNIAYQPRLVNPLPDVFNNKEYTQCNASVLAFAGNELIRVVLSYITTILREIQKFQKLFSRIKSFSLHRE